MTPDVCLRTIIAPSLLWMQQNIGLVPVASRAARLALLCYAQQESGCMNIQQGGDGPGRGLFQMEPPTCDLVLNNRASMVMAHICCMRAGVEVSRSGVYGALITDPVHVAVPFARFDIYCDSQPIPTYGDEDGLWQAYAFREWRPGAVARGGASTAMARSRWTQTYAMCLAADKVWEASSGAKLS